MARMGQGDLALAREAEEATRNEEAKADRRFAGWLARRDRIAADVAMFTAAASRPRITPTTEVTTR